MLSSWQEPRPRFSASAFNPANSANFLVNTAKNEYSSVSQRAYRLWVHVKYNTLDPHRTRRTRRKASGAERYCFDGADPITSTGKSVGPDFGHDGWLAPNDHLRDIKSNRRYNWFDKNRPVRERIFPTVLLTWRKCTREKCCDGSFGKFWKSIEGKQIISNVQEGCDGVDKGW